MNLAPEGGTRQRILAAAENFFAESGYHGTRLHQIADELGIQKASLFHYFESKAHLYHTVLDENLGEIEETLRRGVSASGSPIEKVQALAEAYVDLVASHHQRTKIFLRQSLRVTPNG